MNNKLTLNVGPMFSGKTTALQQQGRKHFEAQHKIIFLKPMLDNRYSNDEIVSHDGAKVKAINIKDTILIDEVFDAEIILIDEVQFLPVTIVDEVWQLLSYGKTIYCSGLDTDYRGQGFETTMKLFAIADKVNKFSAVCKCGAEAILTRKRNNNGKAIELGSGDLYYACCRICFMKAQNEMKG